MKKRILCLILVISIVSSFMVSLPIIASAETIASGTCGENLTWVLDNNGTLTISGFGEMYDYGSTYNKELGKYATSAPWGYDIKEAPLFCKTKKAVT